MSGFINISAYRFVHLDQLTERRSALLELCQSLGLKGTILLSSEGINIFVSGLRTEIDSLVQYFEQRPEYQNLPIKESVSDEQPFTRMLVRIKKEIIAFGVDGIDPATRTSPKLSPGQLKRWLDEGRDMTLLDVRNDYEVKLGTFDQARPIGIDHFRDFPRAVDTLPDSMKSKPVVMFCTGGIRCEKAGPLLQREGFSEVYQLDGGILKYFEECGEEHYQGECFVFDKRVAVDPQLNETATTQCYACQHPLTPADQQSEHYLQGQHCPFCYRAPAERMQQRLDQRNQQIRNYCSPLPGSQPYDNHRPMNVPLRFDGLPVIEFLSQYHPHVERQYWSDEVVGGRILYKDHPLPAESTVWAGQRLVHLLAGTVEPEVNGDIRLLYEDDWLIAVDKPAPLAMHPCGRFNRNSLSYILNGVYAGEKIRMTHRLDANTTGVVVFARKHAAAQKIQSQFKNGSAKKVYLARVIGQPGEQQFECDAAIANQPAERGLRLIDPNGHQALTMFELIESSSDGTSLIQCRPITGRTNQIRLHLWHLGFPICNDPAYLPDGELGVSQTLKPTEKPMCLHAWRLSIEHPDSGARLELESPLPEFAQTMETSSQKSVPGIEG